MCTGTKHHTAPPSVRLGDARYAGELPRAARAHGELACIAAPSLPVSKCPLMALVWAGLGWPLTRREEATVRTAGRAAISNRCDHSHSMVHKCLPWGRQAVERKVMNSSQLPQLPQLVPAGCCEHASDDVTSVVAVFFTWKPPSRGLCPAWDSSWLPHSVSVAYLEQPI